MRKGPHLAASLFVAASVAVAADSSARPTAAYSIHAGFSTALHNVADGHEECLDANPGATCRDKGGVVVAEGATNHMAVRTSVKIREYRRTGATARDLEALAKKLMTRAALGRELRLVTGTAGGRPAVEQWALWDACARRLAGRVFVALPDKIVEIEAITGVEPNDASVLEGVTQVTRILHGVRVRRLGDVQLDPAAAAPAIDQILESVVGGC